LRNEKELAATVRAAMKKRGLKKEQLAQMLRMHPMMIDKLLCGEIHPSSHLEEQMIKVLGINEQRVTKMAQRRGRRSNAKSRKPSTRPKAA
jgi:ribosome-binding protein aMBF1 (putative translation factor)